LPEFSRHDHTGCAKLHESVATENRVRIFQVDAFTDSIFSGNPATVVLDADGCDEATLAAIAREFPHAETAFVFAAGGPDHDLKLRFFNAVKETPFVGHATLAAHSVLLSLGRRRLGVTRQLSGTGILDVGAREVTRAGRRHTEIEFRQSVPELDAPLPLRNTLRVAEALRLPGARLHESLPARIARKGSTRLLVPVADDAALASIAPNFSSLLSLGQELGADGFFAFVMTQGADGLVTDARMFCPALGIAEDPVSGNAHAMLAAYLWDKGLLRGATHFVGRQGAQLGRPGRVAVTLDTAAHADAPNANSAGALVAVRIGGSAVIVSEGTLAADN